MIFKFAIRRLSCNTMMDDKDGRSDIPDKLLFDIRAYVTGLLFDPSQFVSDTLHFAAGDKWRRCVCMNIMKPYRDRRARDAHQYTYTLAPR